MNKYTYRLYASEITWNHPTPTVVVYAEDRDEAFQKAEAAFGEHPDYMHLVLESVEVPKTSYRTRFERLQDANLTLLETIARFERLQDANLTLLETIARARETVKTHAQTGEVTALAAEDLNQALEIEF